MYKFLLLFPGVLFAMIIHGQGVKDSHKLNWKGVKEWQFEEGSKIKYLHFSGAIHNSSDPRIPVFVKKSDLKSPYAQIDVELEIIRTSPLDAAEQKLLSGWEPPSDPVVNRRVGWDRKQPVSIVEIVPITRSAGGRMEKITEFKLNITGSGTVSRRAKSGRDFTQSSKLSSGTWFKIGVARDGVYRIDREFLQNLGVNVEQLDPRQLNIYGNGFGQLPYDNSVERPDDLRLNAIKVNGESDGSMDEGDEILFYAKGPHKWNYDSDEERYIHDKHLTCDTSYYFIGIGVDPAERIPSVQSTGQSADRSVSSFDDYAFHEVDANNLLLSGAEWYGEQFDVVTTYSFTGEQFTFPNIDGTEEANVFINAIGRSVVGSTTFELAESTGNAVDQATVSSVQPDYTATYARTGTAEISYTTNNPALSFSIDYQKNVASDLGWLNYIEANVRRNLVMTGDQMDFRDRRSVGSGQIAEFVMSNANSVQEIWDVTEPTNAVSVQFGREGSSLTYRRSSSVLREYVAITNSVSQEPFSFGRVDNQNLHSLGLDTPIDMVIVTHPLFMAQAQELAEFHRSEQENPLTVAVVTEQQVFNEFSSGMRDVTAIKDFMRMLYERAGDNPDALPRYLLLFGDGSYDNRNGTNNNTNYIVTYQSPESLRPTSTYVSDDYFGFLDPDESDRTSDIVDLGIGRMPVKTVSGAQAMVNKIKRYMSLQPATNLGCTDGCNEGTTNFGDWRNVICLVADDADNPIDADFMDQTDEFTELIQTQNPFFNVERIYLDNYTQQSAAGSQSYPEAREALRRRVEQGALIVNYVGHGGETGLSSEGVLNIPMVQNWDNLNRLPLFVTATCEFSRYDDPNRTSAGELVLLNPNGGGMALMTTTRLVFISANEAINDSFFENAFLEDQNVDHRIGDIVRLTKADNVGSGNDHMSFALLGDPAIKLQIPEHRVETTSITDTTGTPIDTLQSLDVVRVSGRVVDRNGNMLENFQGVVRPIIYDKRSEITTLGNDGQAPHTYEAWRNVIYKGNADVENGLFTFDFFIPKDIDYRVDSTARISYYGLSETADATGYTNGVTIGGINPDAPDDNQGPELNLFMNDENFVFGGHTDENPTLIADVFDPNGINTVGSGIGHNITAVLDGDNSNALVLNDYYEADLNTYKSGRVNYQFNNLEDGEHNLKFKIWDSMNNSSESYIEFIVASSEEFALRRVLNYPNPFTTSTEFYFEHNQSCEFFNVQVQVYSVGGKLVKTINTTVNSAGFRNEPIKWDGRDDFGDKLARGVYVYRVQVRNPSGQTAEKMEKLVILK